MLKRSNSMVCKALLTDGEGEGTCSRNHHVPEGKKNSNPLLASSIQCATSLGSIQAALNRTFPSVRFAFPFLRDLTPNKAFRIQSFDPASLQPGPKPLSTTYVLAGNAINRAGIVFPVLFATPQWLRHCSLGSIVSYVFFCT